MGTSDAGRDPLRLLSFKVQEGDGRPMFRKDLRRRQADTLCVAAPEITATRSCSNFIVSFLLYLVLLSGPLMRLRTSSAMADFNANAMLIVEAAALLNAGGRSRLSLCKDGPPDDILTKDGVLTIDGVR